MQYTAYVSSVIGNIEIKSDTDFIHEINFVDHAFETTNTFIPPVLQTCIQQLQAYFAGTLKTFTVPYKLIGTDFQVRVWQELEKVPYGQKFTYAQQAVKLGDIKAIRAVGTANGKNKLAIVVPCHRIVGTNGSLTGYAGGIERKKWLLQHEMQHSTNPNTLF